MSAHTPGPWVWQTGCSWRRLASEATGNDGDVLMPVVDRTDGHPNLSFKNGGFTGPDARLIAAAPELLEALREITADYADRFDLDSASTNPGIKSSIKQARAAIGKATGESA